MPRKNKVEGALPGAGRPKKDYVKKNMSLTPEAAAIISDLPKGVTISEYVSQAIVDKHADEAAYVGRN